MTFPHSLSTLSCEVMCQNYLFGLMDESEQKTFQTHKASCRACQAEVEAHEAWDRVLIPSGNQVSPVSSLEHEQLLLRVWATCSQPEVSTVSEPSPQDSLQQVPPGGVIGTWWSHVTAFFEKQHTHWRMGHWRVVMASGVAMALLIALVYVLGGYRVDFLFPQQPTSLSRSPLTNTQPSVVTELSPLLIHTRPAVPVVSEFSPLQIRAKQSSHAVNTTSRDIEIHTEFSLKALDIQETPSRVQHVRGREGVRPSQELVEVTFVGKHPIQDVPDAKLFFSVNPKADGPEYMRKENPALGEGVQQASYLWTLRAGMLVKDKEIPSAHALESQPILLSKHQTRNRNSSSTRRRYVL